MLAAMHIGHRYRLLQTLTWSRSEILFPLQWATAVTIVYTQLELTWMALPALPMSLIGIAVAFYLGFKNNASYDRMWEARKIWGAIVNASRSWAFGARDLVSAVHGGDASADELQAARAEQQPLRVQFEIPFVTPQGTAMAHFEIAEDGGGAQ